jgi:hypothetical protein
VDFDWYVDNRLVHEFHTSERKSFRGCRRRWDWIFREGWYPIITAKPLDFGTAYHVAKEVLYDPNTWGMDREVLLEVAIKAFRDKTNAQRAKVLNSDLLLDDDVDGDFDERVELGVGMLRNYWNNIAPGFDEGLKPLAVEASFMVPIPNPETGEEMWCKCDVCYQKARKWDEARGEEHWPEGGWQGLPVVYAGRIDCLMQDENGGVWIVDWKTAARLPENQEWLDLDDQIASYCWAFMKLGMKVRGFIYVEQKKAFPLPPTRNKHQRLGRWYSVKADMDTDYETYLKTIKEGDPEGLKAGVYDNYLNDLQVNGRLYHRRTKQYKSTEELGQVQKNLGEEVLDMLEPNLRLYPNPGRFGCTTCAFLTPCVEKNRGSDYTFALETMFERRPAYYLREESSTDKKSQM